MHFSHNASFSRIGCSHSLNKSSVSGPWVCLSPALFLGGCCIFSHDSSLSLQQLMALTLLPSWSLQRHVMRLFCYCITTSPPFLLFALATRPTLWTPRLPGWPRNCTASWVVVSFRTTKLSYKSPPSLGFFAIIPKAKHGLPHDQTTYCYLNAVHMDIAFGNCLSVGSFHYALILVDRATKNNWTFWLQTLSSECILSALCLFQSLTGSLACCFDCDCNAKRFGIAISEYLIANQSKAVAAPAKWQLSNCLVESHWKTMIHMAHAYLMEKKMPQKFWFYAITHAVQMMNPIPGKLRNRLASVYFLVHGIGHNVCTWIPVFSIYYF